MENSNLWSIVFEGFESTEEGLREALCTLGNGYFGTRGSAPEAVATKIHYPGTYIAGVYNRLPTHIAGRTIYNEDLVNCPSWTFLIFKIGDGEWFYPASSKILSYRQELDMKRGVLIRDIRFKDRIGQITSVHTEKIVHMDNPHIGAIKYTITPENYSSWIKVRRMLDGAVLNTGVERYRQLNHKHWKFCSSGSFGQNGIYLCMRTSKSRIHVCEASNIRVYTNQKEIKPKIKHLIKRKERIGQEINIYVDKGKSYTIEKTVAIYTSNDEGIKNPKQEAIKTIKLSPKFNVLLKTHQDTWAKLWEKYDIKVEGDLLTQKVLRLHMFHLLQTASIHNKNTDSGLPARGLHGEAYRGHIFWDELYAMAFYDFHNPEISKALLLYRHKRLSKAREYAKKHGYKGAMFPWQSGSTGVEETQIVHLNPLSGEWGPDYSSNQRHVNFAIAYNVWKHWERTGDYQFMLQHGAELFLSIAHFSASLARYNHEIERYNTRGLMGPDEFHEKYPKTTKPGLKDNAYTNFMIVWILLKSEELLRILPANHKERLMRKIGINKDDLLKWDRITRKMNIVMNDDGIISQFDGYMRLKELDWKRYREEYGDIGRMDRILKAEGRSPDDYKVSKQADVLMIFYLFPLSEIQDIFHMLGYRFTKDMPRRNYEYYLKRTSHGSTLSLVVHCLVAFYLGKPQGAWQWFHQVLRSDLYDIQGGTTPEGIHVGVMGGSIDIVMRVFAGIRVMGDMISIDPNLPQQIKKLSLKFQCKRKWISLILTKNRISILIHGSETDSMPMEVKGRIHNIVFGRKLEMKI